MDKLWVWGQKTAGKSGDSMGDFTF